MIPNDGNSKQGFLALGFIIEIVSYFRFRTSDLVLNGGLATEPGRGGLCRTVALFLGGKGI